MKIYTVKEIAGILRVTPLTVAQYLREGNLKASASGKSGASGRDLQAFVMRR